jgi:hypothetical protein
MKGMIRRVAKSVAREAMLAASLFLGAVGGAMVGFAGGIPSLPSSPTYSEASQIVGTLNALINQLNGNALGFGGYATQSGNIASLGSFCSTVGATPQTCNAQRGFVNFTGIGSLATDGASTTLVINNNLLTANNLCQVTVVGTTGAAGSAPVPLQAFTGAGNIQITLANAGATATGAFTEQLSFNCIN